MAECLQQLACVAAAAERPPQGIQRAARLWSAAAAICETIAARLPLVYRRELEPVIARAHAQLDEATWAAAWDEGRAMTVEQAVAYALAEDEDDRAVGEQ